MQMVGGKKKTKVSEEDRLSQLPDHLRSEILYHLSTKDAVRTSVLSTKWRDLWQLVPVLDLDSCAFSNFDAFVSFAKRFVEPHSESWIRKLRLRIHDSDHNAKSYLIRWIDSMGMRRIQHLDVSFKNSYRPRELLPMSIYTCHTLVHLRLCEVTLGYAEFVSLSCLKILHLEFNYYQNNETLQKLISGSLVLEDLTIFGRPGCYVKALQVCSQTLKIIRINEYTLGLVVIDAPLLQCLKTKFYNTKNYQIINSGFFTKLDIDDLSAHVRYSESLIFEILTDISKVRELVIGCNIWKEIFIYSKSGPVLQFCHLSHLNAKIYKSDMQMLPSFLQSCPKLESLILELVRDLSMGRKKKKEPNVMFSTVPQCLVSSLKFVELKRSMSGCEGEMELLRYLLKNSTILKKLRLDISCTNKAMCAFLKEVIAMPRCSSACEVLVL